MLNACKQTTHVEWGKGRGAYTFSFLHLALNQIYFNFFLGGVGVLVGITHIWAPYSLWVPSSMVFLSITEARDESTVHTLYARLDIHGASRGHSVRLPLNPQLPRGRSRLKFKWPDDLEASVIKARIMEWRGRETVSGFRHSLLHGIIVPRCFKIFLYESVKYGSSRNQRSTG